MCGNAKNNLEEMCKCYPDNISIDENVPLDFARELCTKYGISLGGNIKLTVTMLLGDPIDNINGAKNCMQIGGKKGYILSPGCDMPYNTPVDNVKAITSVVHGEEVEFMEVKSHELSNLTKVHEIKGLEVEKFPAIIVNDEQISAGELPDINYLKSAIKWGSQLHE